MWHDMSKPVRFVRSAEQADAEMGDANGADDADYHMVTYAGAGGRSFTTSPGVMSDPPSELVNEATPRNGSNVNE